LGDRVNGKVTLVQLGDMDGEVYLFDVQVQAGLAGELKRLLESPEVVKVS
jgi:ribonuclease D